MRFESEIFPKGRRERGKKTHTPEKNTEPLFRKRTDITQNCQLHNAFIKQFTNPDGSKGSTHSLKVRGKDKCSGKWCL